MCLPSFEEHQCVFLPFFCCNFHFSFSGAVRLPWDAELYSQTIKATTVPAEPPSGKMDLKVITTASVLVDSEGRLLGWFFPKLYSLGRVVSYLALEFRGWYLF